MLRKGSGGRAGGMPLALMAGVALSALCGASPALAQDTETPTPAPTPAPAPAPAPSQTDSAVTPEAASPGDATAPSSGTRTYTPADFARFAPRTALDMLQRVPGFAIQQAVQERGLGQATGNVLLNGQRISNKSDDVITQLGRVPAGNVVRIEIADAATLDIPGLSGQVANIIVRSTNALSGQFSYSPEFRTNYADPNLYRFSVSVSGKRGPVDFTLGLENQASRSSAGGPTLILNRDNSLRESRQDEFKGNFDQPRASARFVIDGPGSSIGNLNMIYREFWYDYVEDGLRMRPGQLPFERDVLTQEDGHNYEIGGDFEFALGDGRLKVIGLQRASHSVLSDQVISKFQDGRASQGSFFGRDSSDLERIGRLEYRWKGGGADWQLSGEAAFNALDTSSELARLRPDGSIEPIPFPNSAARVEEARYEGILSYGRPLSENLTVQIAAGAEYSQLGQVGANGLTREFIRPKGQLTAAWTPDPNTTVNLRLQRRVGQISFFDFVSSVNLRDDRENEGNVNLVPPQSWEAEVEAVRRLGAWGSTTLRAYYHRVEDVIDIIPIGANGQGVGNIDSAIRMGVDSRSTINFDPIGLPGARMDLRFILQHTEVEDPLTGELRPISGSTQKAAELSLRYDIPKTDWAIGGAASYSDNAFSYRLTEFGLQTEGPVFANVFVENKDVFGLTVRATAGNVFDARSTWERFVYEGRRNSTPLDFIELRDRLIGPIFSFQIRGKF
ncbi:MAG TPA: TonB-dependent receptor plug domain-containing protein [Allosphingosinicella sp.]|nr:TonB-dependent receptor plug domain-containing protein [Allosphingosinicella sp.]